MYDIDRVSAAPFTTLEQRHYGSFERFVISHIWGYLMTGIIDQSAHEMRSTLRVQEQD